MGDSETTRKWKLANPAKVRAQSRRYYQRHKDRITAAKKAHIAANRDYYARYYKKRDLRNRYGISLEEYERMHLAQGGVCAICKADEELCVDHDHSTGVVRGLLCASCNAAIGLFHESVPALASAITYLDQYFSSAERA